VRAYEQRRINNNSKCSNCYGPRAFGDPAVLCVKFVLCDIQGYVVEFRQFSYPSRKFSYPRKTLRKGALYFIHDAETLFAESKFARNL